jgi:hypothetical protein
MAFEPTSALRTALALFLFLAASAEGFCSVRVFEVMKSSQRARITTEQFALPLGGTRVEVYREFGPYGEMTGERPRLVLISDAQGQVVLPRLPGGKYHILALAKPNLRDDIYLNISIWASGSHRKFKMHLVPYDPPPTYGQMISTAEISPDVEQLAEFHGVVCDPMGVPISNGSVDVVFKGTEGKKYAARLFTDASGRFSAILPEGDYVAFFHCRGFSDRVIVLAILKTGSSSELQVKMRIAPASE